MGPWTSLEAARGRARPNWRFIGVLAADGLIWLAIARGLVALLSKTLA